ncbi:uncharacterized protein [Antedon mediterranea]|uniref:uncharacterized protein n=1 Tax=Antedon mediterranea TaxID=105859 RepID=UPI003AF93074
MDNGVTAANISNLREQNDTLLAENRAMGDKLDELEQYSRRNCLLLHGVPESFKENTDTLALDVITTKISEGVELCDIDRTHRLGRKKLNPGTDQLKKSGYSITENLTLRHLNLLHLATRSESVEAARSTDGRVHCLLKNKKKIVIRSDSDLNHL